MPRAPVGITMRKRHFERLGYTVLKLSGKAILHTSVEVRSIQIKQPKHLFFRRPPGWRSLRGLLINMPSVPVEPHQQTFFPGEQVDHNFGVFFGEPQYCGNYLSGSRF